MSSNSKQSQAKSSTSNVRAEPKLPDESSATDKAIPVKALHFKTSVKWPEKAGAGTCLMVGTPGMSRSNSVVYCDSIFLYRNEFCIDGRWWLSKADVIWEF